MNAKKLIYAAAVLLATGSISSCSDNYLQLAPETSISNDDVTSTVSGARLAMIGICQAMWQQYQDIAGEGGSGYNFMNGEAYINHRMNDAFGPDHHVGTAMSQWGYEIMTGQSPWQKDNYVMNVLPWKYCYNLIQQANVILSGIDAAEGADDERAFVKAQVLTLRAHGYTKLMQYYAPRWENSRNGEAVCAVMRTAGNVEDAPLCTMNDVFKLIYDDLNTAIELYQSSGLKRETKWMPDLNVAYGIYARAAMIIHDYTTAQKMAHNASEGYEVMDNKTYMGGFYSDNNDFMWVSSEVESDIYYWSEYCMFAPNGSYTAKWQVPDGIDYDLYRQLDPNDIRRQCYLTPDKIDVLEAESKTYNPGKITEAEFWNPALVNATANCDLSIGPYAANRNDRDAKWGLYNVAVYYSNYYARNLFTGDLSLMVNPDSESGDLYAYIYIKGAGNVRLSKTEYATLNSIPFGAQYKIWAVAPYSSGTYPFMRATEMKLLEAEAAYYNGEETTALALLKSINDIRIPGYSFSGSGQKLLDEIRLCRRIELWGEGCNWSDFKRWNLPIERRAWVPNDPTSGNWQSEFAVDTPVDANGGWRMLIPRSEIEYNKAIDKNLLEYN